MICLATQFKNIQMRKFTLSIVLLLCGMMLTAQNVPARKGLNPQTLSVQQNTATSTINTPKNADNSAEYCGTDEYMEELFQDPVVREAYLTQRAQFEQEAAQRGAVPCTDPLIVPVAIHYGPPVTAANPQCLIDAALAQIAQLNLDFSSCNQNVSLLCDFAEMCPGYFDVSVEELMPEDGTCIQFCLADQNLPVGEDNIGGYGITVGDYIWTGGNGDTQNNWDGYMNIFVGDYQGGGILGIAPLFGGNNPSGDGVYVLDETFGATGFSGCISGTTIGTNTTYSGGAVATHEVGHYFGLQHTFGDNLADTPPQSNPNFGCPVFDAANCTSGAGNDYSGNFMDYVEDDCKHNFTADQVNIMQTVAADQNVWSTNAISCFADWQNGTNTYSSCEGLCVSCLFEYTVTTVCSADMTTYTITVTITGGFGPFTLTESSGTAPESYTDVPAGTYTFTIAAGSSPLLVITDAGEGACQEATTISDACAPACGITTASVINPDVQCQGADITFDIVIGTCTGGIDDGTGSGDDFLLVYDVDVSNTPPTLVELYEDLVGIIDLPDLIYYGENSNCDGTAGSTPGFTGLEGFEVNDCNPFTYEVYIIPFNLEASTIDFDCPVEGPISATVYPTFTPVVIDTSDPCRPTATLTALDGTVCATADSGGADCTGNIPFDFIADLGLPLNAPIPCDWLSFVGELPCDCLTCPNYVQTTVSAPDACDGQTVTICVEFDNIADPVLVNGTGVANPGDTQICYDVTAANTGCTVVAQTDTPDVLCILGNIPIPANPATWNSYPALAAMVANDGADCGTLQVNLMTADGTTVCATESLACTNNSTTLNADFSADYPDPAGCSALTASATCSNCGACEEEISYNISGGECDMTGATVELFDASGASIGSQTLGMGGGAGSFGIQPCGGYSIVINGAPACYIDAGGDVGPRNFSIDGSGSTTQFLGIPSEQVPTLGEWGLIILGLLMLIIAVVGIRQRQYEFS